MSNSRQDLFLNLLRNERGFHLLFCDLTKTEFFSLYHNSHFAEDPVFNHFVIDSGLLESLNALESSRVKLIVQKIRSEADELKLNTSVFMENFWPRASQFEKVAMESGYRVSDKMEIFTKTASKTKSKSVPRFAISITEDVEQWNRVFMSSYSIPLSWEQELLSRERLILQDRKANFVICKDPSDTNSSIGCLLLYPEPEGYLGIYCVGTVPRHRGRGVAKEMMEFAEECALKSGSSVLTLQTLTSDHVSSMYKKIGYKTEFERDILWSPSPS